MRVDLMDIRDCHDRMKSDSEQDAASADKAYCSICKKEPETDVGYCEECDSPVCDDCSQADRAVIRHGMTFCCEKCASDWEDVWCE